MKNCVCGKIHFCDVIINQKCVLFAVKARKLCSMSAIFIILFYFISFFLCYTGYTIITENVGQFWVLFQFQFHFSRAFFAFLIIIIAHTNWTWNVMKMIINYFCTSQHTHRKTCVSQISGNYFMIIFRVMWRSDFAECVYSHLCLSFLGVIFGASHGSCTLAGWLLWNYRRQPSWFVLAFLCVNFPYNRLE